MAELIRRVVLESTGFSGVGVHLLRNGSAMLVLSRKVGERILIGDNIAITVVRLTNGGVRLGIEAPNEMSVVREEVKNKHSVFSRDKDSPATR